MILGRTIDVITRHTSHRARSAIWPGGRTPHRRRTEEDVMAQPRPSRAHVTGRTAAIVLLAASPAGTPGIPSFDRITPGGLPVLLPCPVACAAAAALLSVPARQAAPAGCWGNDRPQQTRRCDEAMRGRCLKPQRRFIPLSWPLHPGPDHGRGQRLGGARRGSRAHMPAVAPVPYASRWFRLQTIALGRFTAAPQTPLRDIRRIAPGREVAGWAHRTPVTDTRRRT
jgi:hypothetical protein